LGSEKYDDSLNCQQSYPQKHKILENQRLKRHIATPNQASNLNPQTLTYPINVLVNLPVHANISGPLTYLHETSLEAGTLVRVPFGKTEVLGVVWVGVVEKPKAPQTHNSEASEKGAKGEVREENDPAQQSAQKSPSIVLKHISSVIEGIPALNPQWLELVGFAAGYYQRSLGEMALQALPPQLRDLDATQIARRLKKSQSKSQHKTHNSAPDNLPSLSPAFNREGLQITPTATKAPSALIENHHDLTHEQLNALEVIERQTGAFLIFGNTGSGKTEVYMRRVQATLAADPKAQVLVMVPEINLTPQLEERFKTRFAGLLNAHGSSAIVCMHSAMTPAQRLQSWLAAHSAVARIILGTRMAIFASLPHLKLIVVDEEHDPSYKQQEGARYSARDLAIYRAKQLGIKVILGSATPSLESWHHAQTTPGSAQPPRYHLINMPSRIGQAQMPKVQIIDLNLQPRGTVFSNQLLEAIKDRVQRDEQVLILLNRRGYAPVLHCRDCDWKSACLHCSAFRVFHKVDRTLRCHHCGVVERVPRHCPSCGNADISPLGKGTEQLEELLAELLQGVRQPNGQALNILRIDADSTRLKGSLNHQLAQVHSGEVNILVGTQMIAKGHDFRKITLVAALYPDAALFSSDFRAPERLFSLLLQAAGRAGRDALLAPTRQSEMWIQTQYPDHPLFQALRHYDYTAFATQQLLEREQGYLPPFSFQALIRADARSQSDAQLFLNSAREHAEQVLLDIRSQRANSKASWLSVEPTLYPAIPMTLQRIANIERAQMLIECGSRLMMQEFLKHFQGRLQALQPQFKGVVRWVVDVDPLTI
jgi:primosomal protein N' (replication factor Y)